MPTTTPTCWRWARGSSALGLAEDILDTFLTTDFEGGRHAHRVAQIADLEAQF